MNVNFPIQIDQQKMLTFGDRKLPLTHATRFARIDETRIRVAFQDPAGIGILDFMCQTAAKADELARLLLDNFIEKTNDIDEDAPLKIKPEVGVYEKQIVDLLSGNFTTRETGLKPIKEMEPEADNDLKAVLVAFEEFLRLNGAQNHEAKQALEEEG